MKLYHKGYNFECDYYAFLLYTPNDTPIKFGIACEIY